MRNMSFALTTQQVLDRTKHVTRRKGWVFLKAYDRVQAVEKCMGLKKGEKVVPLGVIEVRSVWREPLHAIEHEPGACASEGFPGMTPREFIAMYCECNGGDRTQMVTRIGFRYVEANS